MTKFFFSRREIALNALIMCKLKGSVSSVLIFIFITTGTAFLTFILKAEEGLEWQLKLHTSTNFVLPGGLTETTVVFPLVEPIPIKALNNTNTK